MDGWIKLHRSIDEWEWRQYPETLSVWLYFLTHARHEAGIWQGVSLEAGQLVSGRKSLSKKLGISERAIRTAINRLKSTNAITIKTTNKYTLVTVANWAFYQRGEEKTTSNLTNTLTSKRPANDQKTTTNKNDNIINIYPQTPKGGYAANSTMIEELVNYSMRVHSIASNENDPTIRKHLNSYLQWGVSPEKIKFAIDCVGRTKQGGKTSLDRIVKSCRDNTPNGLKDWEIKAVQELVAERKTNRFDERM